MFSVYLESSPFVRIPVDSAPWKQLTSLHTDIQLLFDRAIQGLSSRMAQCGEWVQDVSEGPLKEFRQLSHYAWQHVVQRPTLGLKVEGAVSPDLDGVIHRINQALTSGQEPFQPLGGLAGSYILANEGIFKPRDEEAYAPNNPKDWQGEFGEAKLRKGILVGEGIERECLAYKLDHEQFSGVPPTCRAELTHEQLFDIKEGARSSFRHIKSKEGSFQVFVPNNGAVGELSKRVRLQIPAHEIQKIALLDMRLFNTDRHLGNILAEKVNSTWKLAPIDHGMILPRTLDQARFHWLALPQTKLPFDQECTDYIEKLDIDADTELMRQDGIDERAVRISRWATIWLKNAAAKHLPVDETAKFLLRLRHGSNKVPSGLERAVWKSKKSLQSHLGYRPSEEESLTHPKFESFLIEQMRNAIATIAARQPMDSLKSSSTLVPSSLPNP